MKIRGEQSRRPKRIRCGIHIGDSFFVGAFMASWPLGHLSLSNGGIVFGWSFLRWHELYKLRYDKIISIKKRHRLLFNTYRIFHNDESQPNYVVISTLDSEIWDLLSKRLDRR